MDFGLNAVTDAASITGMSIPRIMQVGAAVFMASLAVGWARLDESEPEAVKRYGNPVTEVEPKRLVRTPIESHMAYKKDDYYISVFYKDGKICWETYQREPLKTLTNVEIQTFLKANVSFDAFGKDLVWIPDGSGSYLRKDGKAAARIEYIPYAGGLAPASVSIFSLEIFDRRGNIHPGLSAGLPSGVKAETLRDL